MRWCTAVALGALPNNTLQFLPPDLNVCDPLLPFGKHSHFRMQLDQPELFVYFLLNRRLLFPTHERTPSDPPALRNLGIGQFILGYESGRTGLEFLAICNPPVHTPRISSSASTIRIPAESSREQRTCQQRTPAKQGPCRGNRIGARYHCFLTFT